MYVRIGKTLTAPQKEWLVTELGRLITLIPGKTGPDLWAYDEKFNQEFAAHRA
jgi:hypothetical protein